jgi:hypothetical protein
MRIKPLWLIPVLVSVALPASKAYSGSLTYEHAASALPDAPGPAITLLSITGTSDGTNFNLTLTFANPTIEGPSSGNPDGVYGFVNLDTDNRLATGVSGTFLDSNNYESGFGRYTRSSQGIDAYINLTSERDFTHGAPGLVDFVTTNGFVPVDVLPVTYTNSTQTTVSSLAISIPLSDFSSNGIPVPDAFDFSAIVGNSGNPTDFLPSSSVPEPISIIPLVLGLAFVARASTQLRKNSAA